VATGALAGMRVPRYWRQQLTLFWAVGLWAKANFHFSSYFPKCVNLEIQIHCLPVVKKLFKLWKKVDLKPLNNFPHWTNFKFPLDFML
jgi:hypothetical protein